MKLSEEEIAKIAKLAHLRMSLPEIAAMQDKLSAVLGYVERLSEADTDGVEPIAHITGVENVMREDTVDACPEETRERMLKSFPDREEDQLKVRPVFE